MKKLIASLGGLTVAASLVFGGALAASAEDAPPPEDSTIAVETPVTAPETPVAEEPPAPPVEEAPAEVAAPVVEEVTEPDPEAFLRVAPVTPSSVKLPICHSGNGTNWTYIAPDANGYNGHQQHAYDIYGLSEAECLAKNTVVVDVDYRTVVWLAPAAPPNHFPGQTTPTDGSWTVFTEEYDLDAADGIIANLEANLACESTLDLQVDGYIDDAITSALVAGGVLNGPNNPTEHLAFDAAAPGNPWKFVHLENTTKCETPPDQCEVVSGWFTESDDNAPVQGENGLVFDGGSGSAVGIGYAITGNLQGLPTINYSATGDLGVFYPRIVINSLADGGYAYDSLTVISEGPVTGSSIAASNKRAFVQHTLDEWAALLPGNQLVALFFHLDSGATADQSVTLASVSSEGCGNANWVPEKPKPVYSKDKDRTVDCESGEATITKTFYKAEWTWSDETHEYVLGDPVKIGDKSWTEPLTEDEYLECYGEQPDPLSGSDSTKVCDGSVLVTTATSWTQEYEATQTGYVLGEKVFADPTVTRAPDASCTVTETLALTGGSLLYPLGGSALAAIIAGVWFVVRRRNTSEA